MTVGLMRCRGWLLSLAVLFGAAGPAFAAPVPIGLFSWQDDNAGGFTFGVEAFAFDWPAALVLNDVYVEMNGARQAFFGGYTNNAGVCEGNVVSLEQSSGALQVPGFFDSAVSLPCELTALPADVTSGELRFTYNAALGTVSVDVLDPLFDLAGVDPQPASRLIFFDAAGPVPEPTVLALALVAGGGLVGLRARRRRSQTIG